MKPPSLKDVADNKSSATTSVSIISIGTYASKNYLRWTRALYYKLLIISCLEKFNFVKLLAYVASVERDKGSREREKGETLGREGEGSLSRFLPLPLPFLYLLRRLSNYNGIIWGLCFHLVLSEYSNHWHPIISEMWCHHFSSLTENATFGDSA